MYVALKNGRLPEDPHARYLIRQKRHSYRITYVAYCVLAITFNRAFKIVEF